MAGSERWTRQVGETALALALSLIVVLAVLYAFYWPYVSRLAEIRPPRAGGVQVRYVDAATLLRVGSLLHDKKSSFTNFPEAKPPGVIRIGAFGDSHTYGDEVGEVADFPSQLAALLRGKGITNVEVLNFGSSWHGFGQAFVLWEDLAKKFDLDVVLLGPRTFHADRDTTFNHTDGVAPYFIHSRYVVENGEVRRLDARGDTPTDIFNDYYSFWPRWQYLRYDRNIPAAIQAVLPKGKTLDNPFYYDARSEEAEAGDIYVKLVKKIIDSGTDVIIAEYPDHAWLNDRLRAEGNDRTCVAKLLKYETYPYVAPKNHDSAIGNYVLAQQFLSLLLGAPIEVEALQASAVQPSPGDKVYEGRIRADLFDSFTVEQGNRVVGGFASNETGGQSPTFIKDNGFQYLFGLTGFADTATDMIFLGLKSAPVPAGFHIDLTEAAGTTSVALGIPAPLSGTVMIDGVSITDLKAWYGEGTVYFPREAVGKYFGKEISGGKVRLSVGNQVLLEGAYDSAADSFRLVPAEGKLFFIRADMPAPIDANTMAGQIDLVARKGKQEMRTALGQLKLANVQLNPSSQCGSGWHPALGTRTTRLSGTSP